MRKLSQELPFLNEIEAEQSDIVRIREQRQLVGKIQTSFSKKEQEIGELKALLEKYQVYQQKYSGLKAELAERSHLLARRESEGKLLRRQVEELIREQEQANLKIRHYESEKQQLMRERHLLEVFIEGCSTPTSRFSSLSNSTRTSARKGRTVICMNSNRPISRSKVEIEQYRNDGEDRFALNLGGRETCFAVKSNRVGAGKGEKQKNVVELTANGEGETL
jgi:hypothetical protein